MSAVLAPAFAPPAAPSSLLDRAPSWDLDAIVDVVGDDLKVFRRYFRDAMASDVRLLDLVTRYVLHQKGKQIRPVLVLLAARLCGGVTPATYRGAALVELLHTATLVHDDVVDDADWRRGVHSIKALWGNKVGVLLGDFLLSRGLLLALDHHDYRLLHAVSDAVRRMAEGELLQLEKTRHLDLDEATYFRIIGDKTASLIAACTHVGAISATDDAAQIDRLRHIGETLGLAFQIRDDLFDYGSDNVGKPLGLDVQERKLTLPLIAALAAVPTAEQTRVRTLLRKKKKTRAEVEALHAFVHANGGVAYARQRMTALATEAVGDLLTFPPSDARDALLALARFIVTRAA